MLSQLLEKLFLSIDSTGITNIFIWVVIAVFLMAIYFDHKKKHSKFIEYAPTLMGALGILGTFVGIIIGLLNFDTNNIDSSIPILLGGLKTAFITSIVGMFFAILFNALNAFYFTGKRLRDTVAPENVTPEHIHHELKQQNNLLEKIMLGMNGSEEGSIVGQLKLMRHENNDNTRAQRIYYEEFSNRLWQQLNDFSEMMAKGATAQIINALEKVIIDFNNNLTEQFGENFKALDASVKKLVDWQENYKTQIETMSEQYQQSVDSLVETRGAVAGIWHECKEIPLAMIELRDVIQVNQHQITELSRHLDAFVNLRDKASEAVPLIHNQLEQVGEMLKSGALNVNTSLAQTGEQLLSNANAMRVVLDEGSDGFRQSVLQTQQAFASMAHDVSNSSETLSGSLSETIVELKQSGQELLVLLESHSRNLHDTMLKNGSSIIESFNETGTRFNQNLSTHADNALEIMTNSFDKANNGLTTQIRDSLERFGNTINEQLRVFEEATGREMNKELETLGNALLAISKGFINNYDNMITDYNSTMSQLQSLVTSNNGAR